MIYNVIWNEFMWIKNVIDIVLLFIERKIEEWNIYYVFVIIILRVYYIPDYKIYFTLFQILSNQKNLFSM